MSIYPGTTEGVLEVSDGSVVQYFDSEPRPTSSPLGKGGETVVLIHGTGGTALTSYWAVFPMLATKYRTIALTFDTSKPEFVSLDAFVKQARESIESRCGTAPVVLVGHSLGAVVAMKLAAEHPEMVETLVTVAGWARTDSHQLLRNNLWRRLYETNPGLLGEFMTFCSYSRNYLNSLTEDGLSALTEKISGSRDRSDEMQLNRSVDISGQLADIECPTLVVACGHDHMSSPQQSQLLFGGIKNSCYFEIPSGHSVIHERPSELFIAIRDFLRAPYKYPAGTVISRSHA